jgi:hypothetical protein
MVKEMVKRIRCKLIHEAQGEMRGLEGAECELKRTRDRGRRGSHGKHDGETATTVD